MPVTVNANGAATPPTNEVTIATSNGQTMTAVTLWRKVGGVNTPTRVQPTTGLATRYIEDPESPWDSWVQYVATYTTAGGGTVTETSSAVLLTPTPPAIWAVHPTVPARSMALDYADFSVAGIASLGDVVYAAQATQHKIIGSPTPLLTKVGNRAAAAWQLDLTTMTLQEKARLLSMVNDETPILLRAPAAWGWGVDEGYYAVGDVGEARRLQYGPDPSRTIKLPLTKVAAPAGVQQSDWAWGNLMTGYADWGSVQAAFADWNAVTGNSPT